MRVLIAGAAGFLGSHLTDRFLAEGIDVLGVDNLITGARENLVHLGGHRGFQFLEHDVTAPLNIAGPLHGVLHFASPASPGDYLRHPIETLRVGAEGTRHLLELAEAHGARFLLASTSEVYGDPERHPQREDYWGHVNPIGPRSVYDEAKRYAEALTMAFRRTRRVDTAIVRIFNTYGPRMRLADGRVVANFVVQALRGEPLTIYGDGSQTRSLCFVSDLVEGLYRLFRSTQSGPVNLGNPAEVSVRTLADRVVAMTGSAAGIQQAPLPEDDPKVRQPDIGLARSVLGWEPVVPLAEGLERTVADFRDRLAR